MEIKDLLDLNEKLETRINAYWTYWSVAIFAIAGWLFSGSKSLTYHQAIAVSVGAAVFFSANLGVLWSTTRFVTGVRDEIRLKAKALKFLSPKLEGAFAEDTLLFRLQLTFMLHVVIDAVVLWALFSVKRMA